MSDRALQPINEAYAYQKLFDPHDLQRRVEPRQLEVRAPRAGDRNHRGSEYVFSEEIVLAVNVALATGRPLLVSGASGAGKSALALALARRMGWRFYKSVVTSRTQAQDLLWTYDALARLSDAQASGASKDGGGIDRAAYVRPGPLWWAFDREGALAHQARAATAAAAAARARQPRSLARAAPRSGAAVTSGEPPFAPPEAPGSPEEPQPDADGAVVLLDEIDKADPDVPNNLLVPIGHAEFLVEEVGDYVRARYMPLLVITTNGERALPEAFLRRCIPLKVPDVDPARLAAIGKAHFKREGALCEQLAHIVFDRLRAAAAADPDEKPRPSAAEYLDLVSTVLQLQLDPSDAESDPTWDRLFRSTVQKDTAAMSGMDLP